MIFAQTTGGLCVIIPIYICCWELQAEEETTSLLNQMVGDLLSVTMVACLQDSDSPSIVEIIADPKNVRIRLYCHCCREDKIKVLPVGKPICCGERRKFIDTKYLTIFFIIVIVANC